MGLDLLCGPVPSHHAGTRRGHPRRSDPRRCGCRRFHHLCTPSLQLPNSSSTSLCLFVPVVVAMSPPPRSTSPPIPIPVPPSRKGQGGRTSPSLSLDNMPHSSLLDDVMYQLPPSSFTPASSLCTPPATLRSPRPGTGSRPRVRDSVGAGAVAAPAVSLPDIVAALGGDLSWSDNEPGRSGTAPFLAPPVSQAGSRRGSRQGLPGIPGAPAGATPVREGEAGEGAAGEVEGMGSKDKVGVFLAICSALSSVSSLAPKVL